MADFEEDSVFTEGVRAFEATDPARFDVLNDTIKPLVDRTRYLYDNMGQGGGSQGTPIEWIDGVQSFPEVPEGEGIPVGLLTPGTMYILDNRTNFMAGIVAHSDEQIPEIQSLYECLTGEPLNLKSIPVGAEFHFVLAGDENDTHIFPWSG